jgi:hypothetical protein
VDIGDLMYTSVDVYQILIALINMYNTEVAVPNQLPKIKLSDVRVGSFEATAEIPCRVANIID